MTIAEDRGKSRGIEAAPRFPWPAGSESPALDERGAWSMRVAAFWIGLLAVAWAWSFVCALSFSGEDLLLIDEQRAGLHVSGHVFRPLWNSWFWLLQRLPGGDDAALYHAGSLVLHLANCALVYHLARGSAGPRRRRLPRWSCSAPARGSAMGCAGSRPRTGSCPAWER